MNNQLTELVLKICSEPDAYARLVLLKELKELMKKEGVRLKQDVSRQPA